MNFNTRSSSRPFERKIRKEGERRKEKKKEEKEKKIFHLKQLCFITAHSEQGRGPTAGEAPKGPRSQWARGRSERQKNLGGGETGEAGGNFPPPWGGGKIFEPISVSHHDSNMCAYFLESSWAKNGLPR